MKNEIHELNMTLNQIYRKQDDLYHEYASHFGLSSISFWILYTLCETEDEVLHKISWRICGISQGKALIQQCGR